MKIFSIQTTYSRTNKDYNMQWQIFPTFLKGHTTDFKPKHGIIAAFDLDACSATRMTIGLPAMSANIFPGSLVEACLAGMMTEKGCIKISAPD